MKIGHTFRLDMRGPDTDRWYWPWCTCGWEAGTHAWSVRRARELFQEHINP